MNGRISETIVARFRDNFIADCINGILLGYDKMRSENQYKVHWKENKLTAHLVAKMNETGFFDDKSITIIPQAPLYNDEVNYGDADPDKSPVIDFKFSKSWSRLRFDYFAEAKNLSESDWIKPDGANVEAYHSRSYYISDGIERYLTGYYPKGCLIGYVVNGSTLNVVANLNRLITHRDSLPRIGLLVPDETLSCSFLSQNHLQDEIYVLRHLLLQLAPNPVDHSS